MTNIKKKKKNDYKEKCLLQGLNDGIWPKNEKTRATASWRETDSV